MTARHDTTTDRPRGTALVVGVGALHGLGAALASRFVDEGLRVVIAARDAARLDAVATALSARGTVVAFPCDATDPPRVRELLAAADIAHDLELVVYNAGGNVPAPALELSLAAFEAQWRQNAYGGFTVGQQTIQRWLPRGRGTLIYTGATASLRARPPFLGFAAGKAALRAVAQGLAREFGPQGIHVAHVIIDGVIDGDYARRHFPNIVQGRGEAGLIDAADVADTYWSLHRQPRSAWTHEIDLRPAPEPF